MMRPALGFCLLLAACVAAGPEAASSGYTPIDASDNSDLQRYLPPGVSAANLLLSADACYYYAAAGQILPVRTDAGRYCIG